MLSSVSKVQFVDRIKHMMANKIAIVVGDTTLDNVRIQSDQDEHSASILVAKRKRMKVLIPSVTPTQMVGLLI